MVLITFKKWKIWPYFICYVEIAKIKHITSGKTCLLRQNMLLQHPVYLIKTLVESLFSSRPKVQTSVIMFSDKS